MLRTTHLLKTSIARYNLKSIVSVKRGYQNYRAILSAATSISDSSGGLNHKSLLQWPGIYRIDINSVILEISQDADYAAETKSKHIDERNWLGYLATFRRRLVKQPIEAVGSNAQLALLTKKLELVHLESDAARSLPFSSFNDCKQFLYDIMIKDAEVELRDVIKEHQLLLTTTDMRLPHEWYPYARLMKRKIIFHGGPTNSGKTYQALQRLKNADPEKGGGVYCGPLRLLALEIFESLNRQGVYTNLLTGQERSDVDFATHVSCTVEMVKLDKEYDVAVVDEIQMIANDSRGFAWTRVLLGLRAREIHVCGGMEACEIVRTLMASTGDDFEVINYNRLSTLNISEVSLRGDYSKIQAGDCVVAFSRSDIFSIRKQIERLTPYKCAMIYGQLPPETRSLQARLFNDDNTGYDVLVASDAIGMGLNLNIKRIVFHTCTKMEGLEGASWCDPSSVKQIAGRAGRLSSAYKVGEVTAWQDADLAYIRGVMSWDIPSITAAGIFPSIDLIDLFSQQLLKNEERAQEKKDMEENKSSFVSVATQSHSGREGESQSAVRSTSSIVVTPAPAPAPVPVLTSAAAAAAAKKVESKYYNSALGSDGTRLAVLVQRFVECSKLDGRYYLCDHDNLLLVSNWLHTIPLTLPERFVFANAPVDVRSSMSMTSLYHFAATYAMRKPVALNVRLSRVKPRDVLELSDLCLKHNVLDLYLWLSIRYPEFFVERELCLEQKSFAIECIQESLESTHLQHRFSHSNEYKSMRIKFLTGRSQGLPSLSYGAVRASYENNIALINERDLYVFPTLIEEDGGPNPGHGSNRDKDENTRKPKTMASGKALPVGLLPVSNIRQPIMNKRESTPSSSFFGSDRTPVRSTDQEAGRTPIHHQYSTSKTNLVFNEITRQYEKPKDDVVKPAVVRAADVGVGVAAATGSRTTSDSNVDEKQVKQHSLYKTVGPRPLNSLTKLPLLSLNSWKIGSSNSNSNSNNNSNSSSSSSDRGKHPGTVPWVGTKAPTPGTPAARTGSILSKAMILNE